MQANPSTAKRARIISGLTIGIIIMDTRFRRFEGDIGNASTWPFPVQYEVARGATPQRIVEGGAAGLLDAFLEAADRLVDYGVEGIVTSCGFLAKEHKELVAHCPVPVATSSLLQIPLVRSTLPRGRDVGVLTIDANRLTEAHFAGCGLLRDMPVVGLPDDGIIRANNRRGEQNPDFSAQEREVVEAAERLLREHPKTGAIVLECTNMAPYSETIQARFGLPVYDIVTLVKWFHDGLRACHNGPRA